MKRSDITEVITAFFNPFCWQTDTICRVQQNPDGTWTARLEDVQGNTSNSTEESKWEAIDTAKKQLDLSRTGT